MPVNDLSNTEAFVWRGTMQLITARRRIQQAIETADRRGSKRVRISRTAALAMLEVCDQALATEAGLGI